METCEPIKTRKRRSVDSSAIERKEQSIRLRKLTSILKKKVEDRGEEDEKILQESAGLVSLVEDRIKKGIIMKDRVAEKEDSAEVIQEKSIILAKAIQTCSSLVIYTGAGISTSAKIPDYRGPNGVWTQLKSHNRIVSANLKDLACAEPTYTHMALVELHRRGILKYVVSQNCDGLHVRSGLPQEIISEIHGNMYTEVCLNCKKLYYRDFDVTEKTSFHRHRTGRVCQKCPTNNELVDTIIHFGEKARFEKPYNWDNAARAVERANIILCLGTSLKILRSYRCLWPRRQAKKSDLYIVNLQWTPKDSQALLKINGKCDDVMKIIMNYINLPVPNYNKESDPLLRLHTPLLESELTTTSRIHLLTYDANSNDQKNNSQISDTIKPGWFGRGLRVKRKQ